jgi:hypothetical protein
LARQRKPGVDWRYDLLQASEQAMSFGVGLRNAVAIGLGGIATLFSGYASAQVQSNLITESVNNLVTEAGGLILTE